MSRFVLVTTSNNGLKGNKVYPAGIYLLKVNNRNTRTTSEIYSKLTIKTPEQGVFIVNFEHILCLVLAFLLLTLNMQSSVKNYAKFIIITVTILAHADKHILKV